NALAQGSDGLVTGSKICLPLLRQFLGPGRADEVAHRVLRRIAITRLNPGVDHPADDPEQRYQYPNFVAHRISLLLAMNRLSIQAIPEKKLVQQVMRHIPKKYNQLKLNTF